MFSYILRPLTIETNHLGQSEELENAVNV